MSKPSFDNPFWQGKVVDRDDPKELGRVRVRINYVHSSDVSLVPDDTLPWAVVSMPATEASEAKVGRSATGLTVGANVWGFFLDGNDQQQPVVAGTWWGAPDDESDMSPLVTGKDKIPTKGTAESEPADTSAPKYPYNKVTTTESGHVIEIDDTPGATRISFYHNSGSYQEMTHDGDGIWKVARDGYEIVVGDKTMHVGGNVNITVKGNLVAAVSGTLTATAASIEITEG